MSPRHWANSQIKHRLVPCMAALVQSLAPHRPLGYPRAMQTLSPSPLFPEITPFATHMLPVTDGHVLYVEESGNPHGLPVIVLHGGPGSGSKAKHRQFFNPATYRIIIADQRGAGLSTPAGSLTANTTAHLINDIEAIRTHLKLEDWVVYGNSWGSTLALAYAQAHPQRVKGLVIGAVFTGTERERDWFTNPDGLARFFPSQFAILRSVLGHPQTTDIFPLIHAALLQDDAHAYAVARTACRLDAVSMDLEPNLEDIEASLAAPDFSLTSVRIWAHYYHNSFFLTPNQLLNGCATIQHIPTIITQAGLDLCCPPETAYAIHQALPGSTYNYVHLCGHRANPAMEAARIAATNAMAARLGA